MDSWTLAPHLTLGLSHPKSRALLVGEGVHQIVERPDLVSALENLPTDALHPDLVQAGVLVSQASLTGSRQDDSFWTSLGLSPKTANAVSIAIHPVQDQYGAAALQTALKSVGFRQGAGADLDLVLVSDYLSPILDEVNREHLRKHKPWMPVKLIGHTIWMGPRFSTAPESPCWECLAGRIRENRWIASLVANGNPSSLPMEPSITVNSLTLSLGVAVVAGLMGQWARGADRWKAGEELLCFDTRTLALTHHTIHKRPSCTVCSGSAPRARYSLDHLVSPIIGIVPELIVSSAAEAGFFHAKATVNQPWAARPGRPVSRPGASIGKGRSIEMARRACLAEAVERYSLVFQGDESETRACDGELSCIPLRDLSHFSALQYAMRHVVNACHDGHAGVPEPLDPHRPIQWTRGRYLNGSKKEVFLPSCYCYIGHTEERFHPADSNGCAAGETFEDAALRALCELIERDAAGIWWYNRLACPRVEIEHFDDPEFAVIRKEFFQMGRGLHLLDIGTDLPVPVYAAISAKTDGSDVLLGLGCELDAHQAAYHALAELSQVSFWIGKNRPGAGPWARWFDRVNLHGEPFLIGVNGNPSWTPRAAEACGLDSLVEELASRGFPTAAVDVSRPDLPLQVARVAIPGLRHFWPRFGPGRLYDLPVQMGRLSHARSERDLNPFPCPL